MNDETKAGKLKLKIAQFKDEAQKRDISIEAVRCTFENDLGKGLIQGIIAPNKTEAICFEPIEVEDLVCQLSSGKISLANIAEQLNISVYHAVSSTVFAENKSHWKQAVA